MAEARIQADGPAPSFESFFEAEHARLYRALYLVCGDTHEAEELMQEALLRVWERWDRVREMDEPTGYLYRIAMNLFRSRVRRAARSVRAPFAARHTEDPYAAVDLRDEMVRRLRALTPRQRAALVLTELLGFPSEEAGRMLGIAAATVRALGTQARASMRTSMEAEHE